VLLRRGNSFPPLTCWGKSKAVPVCSMKACGGVELKLHSFLALALDGGEWSASRPDLPPTPGKIPVPVMLCIMLCHVMSCHVMSCHVMSCHVMSCNVMLWVENLARACVGTADCTSRN
jgi:hypothetical protein